MVKKLIKHEILAYLRVWLPIQIILLSCAFLNRLVQFFRADNTVYETIQGSSDFMYGLCIVTAIGFVTVFAITRFHKNLFTHEGYLTFTLPVTPAQHIFVKVLTTMLFQIATVICIFLSVAIVSAGDMFIEIIRAIAYIFDQFATFAQAHTVLYIIEIFVLIEIFAFSGFMFYYMCIAVGQLFKKNRTLAAVGVFFIHNTIMQVLGTVFSILFSYILIDTAWMQKISEYINQHPIASCHIGLMTVTCVTALFAFIYYAITHTIIRKRLNLE